MRLHSLLAVAGIAAVVGTVFLQTRVDSAPGRLPPTPPIPYGHLILQIEGNVTALRVTHITPKESGYNKTRVSSPFRVGLYDAARKHLGSYPLDLSAFDLDPTHIGQPLEVHGCEVRDTNIVTIANVPFFQETDSIQISHGDAVLCRLKSEIYQALVAAGEKR